MILIIWPYNDNVQVKIATIQNKIISLDKYDYVQTKLNVDATASCFHPHPWMCHCRRWTNEKKTASPVTASRSTRKSTPIHLCFFTTIVPYCFLWAQATVLCPRHTVIVFYDVCSLIMCRLHFTIFATLYFVHCWFYPLGVNKWVVSWTWRSLCVYAWWRRLGNAYGWTQIWYCLQVIPFLLLLYFVNCWFHPLGVDKWVVSWTKAFAVYMRGGATWEMLTGERRYGVVCRWYHFCYFYILSIVGFYLLHTL